MLHITAVSDRSLIGLGWYHQYIT